MPEPARAISILIAALGGQGGGVLTEWLVSAAAHAGLPAQATSIPGVAQRTGATTYYVEVFPAPTAAGSPEPVFSLYPAAGDVDVIIAAELLEAGRALEMDYASPERTTLLASTHRLFAIGEKTVAGNGVFPRERLEEAARKLTRRFVGFDALGAARQAGSEVNAILLGALAGSCVLPLGPSDFEAAIREGNVAVERNLVGFKTGMEIVEHGVEARPDVAAPHPDVARPAPPAARHARRGAALEALRARIDAEFPEALRGTLGAAVQRLVDYQDARYAASFLDRVQRVHALDPGMRLGLTFSRRLAVWMTYEDAIRVADLKTRRGRFERIRREHDGATITVTDYLKPDLDEIYGILPASIGGPVARWAERRWPAGRPTLAQHVKTTSVLGFLRLWGLARLRVLRPASLRHQRESALMARWEQAVREAAALDYDLGCEVAELASVVKGYGEVRRRLSRGLARVLDEILAPAMRAGPAGGPGVTRAVEAVREARRRLLDGDGEFHTLAEADHGG